MSAYLALKAIHILAAIVSVGAMLVLPSLYWAASNTSARVQAELVRAADRHVSIGGGVLVVSGAGLTGLFGVSMLHAFWLAGSIGLIVVGMVGDAWAVRWLQARVAGTATPPMLRLHALRLALKGGLFLGVAALMVLKPA